MEELTLAKNGRSTVTLKGHGSAGYRWSCAIDDPRIVRVERIEIQKPPAQHSASYSLDEEFAVIAQSPGETHLHFTLSRPFEKNKSPMARREIHVRVQVD